MADEAPEIRHVFAGEIKIVWIGESSCNIFGEFTRENSAMVTFKKNYSILDTYANLIYFTSIW